PGCARPGEQAAASLKQLVGRRPSSRSAKARSQPSAIVHTTLKECFARTNNAGSVVASNLTQRRQLLSMTAAGSASGFPADRLLQSLSNSRKTHGENRYRRPQLEREGSRGGLLPEPLLRRLIQKF